MQAAGSGARRLLFGVLAMNNKKIVILDTCVTAPNDISKDAIMQMGNLAIYDRMPLEFIAERIGGVNIVISSKAEIDRGL